MTRKQKRLSVIVGGLVFLGAAAGLTFYAIGQKASQGCTDQTLSHIRRGAQQREMGAKTKCVVHTRDDLLRSAP